MFGHGNLRDPWLTVGEDHKQAWSRNVTVVTTKKSADMIRLA